MSPTIEYVLFDLDGGMPARLPSKSNLRPGLLIDTEAIYTTVTNTILAPYGKEMTWDIKAGCMGKPGHDSAVYLLSCFPDIPLTAADFLAQCATLQEALWRTTKLLPGAARLLAHLAAHGVPLALATSSRRRHFELKTAHLADAFAAFAGRVVCSDDARYAMRGKPAPDIFLAAAREVLGRDVGAAEGEATPAQCGERAKGLVFEDALFGVQAGKRAGMSVVWIPDDKLLDVEYSGVEKADQTLKSLEEFVPEEWGLPPYAAA
ncbi:HAD-like domain-containing protein [Mycena pura]|uniref:HAD-like domain-containing protein n=1 Tax=Mycena pura TaxID=153505 RepID=A0AAD6VHF8_9AGAR|nr:HAD-like domain-containing protein [Mycena pura]